VVSGESSACRSALLLTSLDDVVEGDGLFFVVGHCTVREDVKMGVWRSWVAGKEYGKRLRRGFMEWCRESACAW
jgi:hypothetical protein